MDECTSCILFKLSFGKSLFQAIYYAKYIK